MITVRLHEMKGNLLPKDLAPLVVRFELLPCINLPVLSFSSSLSTGQCSFSFQKLWGGVSRRSSSATTYTPPPLLAQELRMREGEGLPLSTTPGDQDTGGGRPLASFRLTMLMLLLELPVKLFSGPQGH